MCFSSFFFFFPLHFHQLYSWVLQVSGSTSGLDSPPPTPHAPRGARPGASTSSVALVLSTVSPSSRPPLRLTSAR